MNEVKQIGNIVNTGNWDNPQRGRIYSADGICPALNTVGGGGLEPKIIEDFYKNRESRVYDETAPTIRAEREGLKVIEEERTYLENAIEQIIVKNNGEIPEVWDLYNKNPINNGIAKTLSTDCGHIGTAGATAVTHNYRIRKLTPKECALLMKFTEEDAEKMLEVNSNTQVYKQCGNSIVVSVLEAIFCQMNIKGCPTWEEYSKERYL